MGPNNAMELMHAYVTAFSVDNALEEFPRYATKEEALIALAGIPERLGYAVYEVIVRRVTGD